MNFLVLQFDFTQLDKLKYQSLMRYKTGLLLQLQAAQHILTHAGCLLLDLWGEYMISFSLQLMTVVV